MVMTVSRRNQVAGARQGRTALVSTHPDALMAPSRRLTGQSAQGNKQLRSGSTAFGVCECIEPLSDDRR